ncbi:MAG: integral membrane protein [Desulfobulbaceae bacterium]|nr:MAG: integral membrane protein [Desulfobulbaceae bacterium]
MEWLSSPEVWMSLITLTALEIVLGVDNIIFIAILVGHLPQKQQARGRTIGLAMAMLTRIGLLFSITLIMRLTHPFVTLFGHGISGRDLILIGGGLFLLAKSTLEIHESLEGDELEEHTTKKKFASFWPTIVQIMILDIVFSLDSVITAVGLSDKLAIMVTAIVIAVGVMLFLAGAISKFVDDHPTIKVLALSFLLLVGMALIGEGFTLHIPKGYIYFAMAFSVFVEMLNMRLRKQKTAPVRLRKSVAIDLDVD